MGFSEHDVPDSDVGFGQVNPVEPSTAERDLTPIEQEAVDAVVAALAVWDEALKGPPPKLAPKGASAEAEDAELTAAV